MASSLDMKSLERLLHPALLISFFCATLQAQDISIQALVTPSTVITKDGRPVKFALHGFIEFGSLSAPLPRWGRRHLSIVPVRLIFFCNIKTP